MSIDISNLHNVLLQKISSTASKVDTLEYTKAIAQLNLGIVTSVFTFSDLPTVPDIVGRLYFVESERALYIYNNEYAGWKLLAFNSINSMWSWGNNTRGILGNYTPVSKSSPASVVSGFADWCQVSAGNSHTAAVRTNGSLWAWGCNSYGKLGDNTTLNKTSPISVVGGFTDWCQVSVGAYHTAAVRKSGTLWTWGRNNYGQLGDNTIVSKSSPVRVVGGNTDWCQVSVSAYVTAAIRSNGTLWSWGRNSYGNFGNNSTVNRSSPVTVVGGFTDWCLVSVGSSHTAAVRGNGTLWAWGGNGQGRLGDNTTVNKSSPVSVVGGFTDWCRVSASGGHTAAVRINGTLWTWGFNSSGQLGDNTTVSKSSPVSVVGGFTDWCQVSAGSSHTAAVRTNGTLWTWGYNNQGRLGDNTTVAKSSAVSVVGGFTDWCQVSAGFSHNVAIRSKTI